ncbi:MAG: hypothetical protein NVS1B3_05420 [Candidatus Dormibacteraceae bacterium]
MAKGLLRPAVVTPGGHRRFLPEAVEAFASKLEDGPPAGLISSKEAARLLGVSQPTLNRAVREGRLRPAAVTPGGHRRFSNSGIFASLREEAQVGMER